MNILKPLLIVLLLSLSVPMAWVVWAYNAKFRQCVILENGLNLGYEAVFDLRRPFFRPRPIPRLPDGTPLVRDELWALYATQTTLYGLSLAVGRGKGFWFAWREDTGLVLEHDNPGLYQRIVDEAGHANWDYGTGSYGTGILLLWLSERPGFGARRCPTALITW